MNQLFEKAMALRDERISALESQATGVNATLESIQSRMNEHQAHLASIDAEISSLEDRMSVKIEEVANEGKADIKLAEPEKRFGFRVMGILSATKIDVLSKNRDFFSLAFS